jgi:hypothetical protein
VKFFTLTIFAGSRYDLLMMGAGLSNQWQINAQNVKSPFLREAQWNSIRVALTSAARMPPRDRHQKVRRTRRLSSGGFVRMPRRRGRRPNPITRAALFVLIALLLTGAIVRRVLLSGKRAGYGHSYRRLSPGREPDDHGAIENRP